MNFESGFTPVTLIPEKIEEKSFEIIDSEIGEHRFDPMQYPIVRRVIHATADFDLGKSLEFHPDAITSGIEAIRKGVVVVTDVAMVFSGVNKTRIEKYGGSVRTYMSRDDIALEAKKEGVTRSIIAMRRAVDEAPDGIFVIGNAPTALLELIRLVREKKAKPALVIGMPVGFVSAVESKEELLRVETPFITNRGRKGGTPAAVAAMNALSILADKG